MSERFDFEAVRHRLKLLRDAGTEQVYENRDGVVSRVRGAVRGGAGDDRPRVPAVARAVRGCLHRPRVRPYSCLHARVTSDS